MKVIAFTSGKGGVGKTNLSSNIGVCLAQFGYRTVVFDADLALANVEVVLGVRAEKSLQHVVAEQATLAEAVTEGPEGLGFVAGGSGVPTLMRSGPKKLALFFEQVQELESTTDVLIYDTAAGLENRVMAFLKSADEVVVVTTPEPASVSDAYATIKTLFRQKPAAVVNVVVNMVEGEAEGNAVFGILEQITADFLGKSLTYLGSVRRDPSVQTAAKLRKPYAVVDPGSAVTSDTKQIAAKLAEPIAYLRVA